MSSNHSKSSSITGKCIILSVVKWSGHLEKVKITDQNIEIATLGSLPVVLIGPVEISVGLEWQNNFCYHFKFGIFAKLMLIIVSIWWTSLNKSPASVEVAITIFWSVLSGFKFFIPLWIFLLFCFAKTEKSANFPYRVIRLVSVFEKVKSGAFLK